MLWKYEPGTKDRSDMEMIIWGSAVSGVFVLCKLLKPTFKKFFYKFVLKTFLNQNRSNGQHHGKEKNKR